MSATISIDKKNIKQFLEESRQRPLLIPEYQRPYEWGKDEIETLFDDLKNFVESDNEEDDEYFLGTIVHYNNTNNQREIIDGHQRIVSLMLLLRAIYTQLESMEETRSILKQKSDLEILLWSIDSISKEPDFSKVLIRSDVIGERAEQTFISILREGRTAPNADDLYSINYRLFQQRHKEYCGTNAEATFKFIDNLLNRVIILPIQADSLDMALTIFSTLNNRGKPLSDADIFKHRIYKTLSIDKRKSFIEQWQELEERVKDVEVHLVDDLFYPYMLYKRATDKIVSSSFSGVRKYFLNEHPKYLIDVELLPMLNDILNFWVITKQHVDIEQELWSSDIKIRQALDILVSYPNDFWEHAVITYYLANHSRADFGKSFLFFLHKLISQIVPRYFKKRGADSIKNIIINLNVSSIVSPFPDFKFGSLEQNQVFADTIRLNVKNPNPIKVLLKILAYSDERQNIILPNKWQVEHIFPRKWTNNYDLNGYTPDKINELVEWIGNLTPFEKKHNIKASNEYFAKKKKSYKQSKVVMTQSLVELSDFRPDDIITRTKEMTSRLKKILSTWSDEYDDAKRVYDQQHSSEALT